VIGWHQDIDGYTLADVMAFQRTWYAPNNAILIVAGDITTAQLKPLAERIYGRIPARPVPPRHRPREAPPIAERRLEIRAEAVQQPVWTRLYLAPSYHSLPEDAPTTDGPNPDMVATASALEVLSQILGGGATSRLYRALVVEHKVASTVSVEYDPDYLGQTDFSISLSPLPDVSMESLEQAVRDQLHALAADGVTDDEVSRAKTRLQAQVTYARDSLHTGARVIGQSLTSGGSVGLVEAWPARIAAVTREQVDAALHRVLRDERSVTARLLPGTADTQTLVVDPAAAAGLAGGRGLR
jgi:zinc protease